MSTASCLESAVPHRDRLFCDNLPYNQSPGVSAKNCTAPGRLTSSCIARASVTSLRLPTSLHQFLLPRLAATGRFLWMLDTSQPIEPKQQISWDDVAPWEFRVKVTAHDDTQEWKLDGELYRGEETLPTSDLVGVMSGDLLLTKTHLGHLQSDIPGAWISWVTKHAPIAVPYQHRDTFVKLFWAAPNLPSAAWPENLALEQIAEPPQPCLRVHESTGTQHRDQLTADVSSRKSPLPAP